jgi:hypothetical protein
MPKVDQYRVYILMMMLLKGLEKFKHVRTIVEEER